MPTKSDGLKHSEELKDKIVALLDQSKAEDINALDIRGKSAIADYMIICSGNNSRQVTSLVKKIEKEISPLTDLPMRIEGRGNGDWALLDMGDIIVHVFRPAVREFYGLDAMWAEAVDDENTEKVIVPAE